MADFLQAADEAVLIFIQENLRVAFLNPVMIFFTHLGEMGAAWLTLALILLFTKKYRIVGFDLVIAIGFCFLINNILIKNLIARPRPFFTMEELTVLIPKPGEFSFPSGHACASFAGAYAFMKNFGKKGCWIYIPAVLIAVSRPYLGVHYVSDIIAGALIGTGGSAFICAVRVRYFHLLPGFFNVERK